MSNFKSQITMTHIGTATALLEIDGISLLTDPVFCDAGSEYPYPGGVLKQTTGPAVKINELPPIDAILLSHEDHEDNLDEMGRRLLDGRRVITTMDGAKNLQPRPGVRGIQPWQTLPLNIGGTTFHITGTPCVHVPGGECTGFILESPNFGTTDGKPNVIYISGDTIYMDELVSIREKYHVSVAIIHLGAAKVPVPGHDGLLQITMGGNDAAKLVRELGADILVPIHFESWLHFTEYHEELRKVFEDEGINDKVCWLIPGQPKKLFK
ncbi:beta-lactamase superfamily domain-containing protein [Phascolomyces articulosus]|uniref:Beta-lactamase superfamily domain-containing protein n=1 Tax=Phascolomyces articulosus TaxID=60185 RepID=A0AAD5PI54_9FUNG|nr:beta-lactamase superfamily domain-containing protein [Phascolomyces articulosus]KAI9272974.1 beta-lactamase superfamily domain-containing protein [Phascolomyces articulosus]